MCFILLAIGLLAPFEVAFLLAAGWLLHLIETVPRLEFNVQAILIGVTCLVLLTWSANRFLTWLYAATQPAAADGWQRRWTVMGVATLAIAFAACIATIGIVHQVVWLLREPVVRTIGSSRIPQKRTMSDLRTIATAVESYYLDYQHLPRYGVGEVERLGPSLSPTFVKKLPPLDAWNSPFIWVHRLGSDSYSVVSLGADRVADPVVEPGATTAFDRDIYFANGQFTVYPEGTQN